MTQTNNYWQEAFEQLQGTKLATGRQQQPC